MVKVLFVCHANINRSPMAEAILRKKIEEQQLTGEMIVDSAGTSNFHAGQIPFPGTQNILKKHQIAFDGIVARQITKEDLQTFDYIIAMDTQNLENLKKLFGTNEGIFRLFDFAPELGLQDVPDPSYTGDWEKVYEWIDQACTNIFIYICEKESIKK